jgi:signal transduction histidine kinase
MKQRLEEIGGNCQIESQLGKGTTVSIYLNI